MLEYVYMKFFDQPQKEAQKIEKITDRVFTKDENGRINSETEKQSLKGKEDGLFDLSEEAFKEINPLGLLLADLKRNLEKEAVELEARADEYRLMGKDEKIMNDLYDQAIEKHEWIFKIDNYLSKDKEVVEDFKIDHEEFKSNLN